MSEYHGQGIFSDYLHGDDKYKGKWKNGEKCMVKGFAYLSMMVFKRESYEGEFKDS